MATRRTVGQPFGHVYLSGDDVSESDDGSLLVTRKMRTLWDSWMNVAPQRGSVHPIHSEATLRERKVKATDDPLVCDVSLIYKSPEKETNGSPDPGAVLPVTRYEDTSSQVSRPIQSHPKWPDWEQYWDYDRNDWIVMVPDFLRGVKDFFTGTVMESETTYYWSMPPPIREVVGEISGGGHLLLVSGSRRREGAYWSRTLNRLYSKAKWPEEIYNY